MKKYLFAILIFLLIGCSNEVDYSAREINSGKDICYVCKMIVKNQHYSVQSIHPNGLVLWYDDIGCLEKLMSKEEWNNTLQGDSAKIWVGHCETGNWHDARKAFYRFGDTTPMGYGYGAIIEISDTVFTFDQTIDRIHSGLTQKNNYSTKKKVPGEKKMKCQAGKCGEGKCGN